MIKISNPIKNCAKDLNRHFSKNKQMTNKHIQRCTTSPISEKYSSKPPWVTTSHPLGRHYQKIQNSKCLYGGEKTEIFVHYWWECISKMVQSLWKAVWQVLEKLKIRLWSSNSTYGYVPKRIETRDSNRYLYTHVYSSIIHN